ncbi:hypothetical protein CBS101457_006763 [Exobasidium rhododendri]|nr:hypothetical protein CBS101457_006763 [Exobasidium rhododendri]
MKCSVGGSWIGLVSSVLLALDGLPFAGADVTLTPAATSDVASSLSNTLTPSYIGLGIEPSNLFAYLGTTTSNVLSSNLLSNLANYTGVPPHIRVGGNTQDTMIYKSTYKGYYFATNKASTGLNDKYIFGPNYFQAINNLPAKTPVSLGLGLAYNGNDAVNMSVTIAQEAVSALTNVDLVALEVGNEPDLYIENQFRNSSWSVSDYGGEWLERVEAIYTSVLKPANIGSAFFEAACTATTAAYPAYKIENLVSTGLGSNDGIYLAGWNQHNYYYYVNVSDYSLTLSDLLSISATSNQFTEWANQIKSAIVTGKPYYLREMGSVGPAGISGISNTFGNALWTLNFFLYAATVGADAVQMHVLQDSYGSPWQPITDVSNGNTFVRPSYYAFAAMNQIIGAKCATKVAPISVTTSDSGYSDRVGAYAVYDGTALQSIVLINTKVFYSGSTTTSEEFVLSLPKLAGQTLYLSTMSASGADATANVTWNGMEYEQSGDGSPGAATDNSAKTAQVDSSGSVTITVRDSQAVVANVGSTLGSQNNVVDTTACTALAATIAGSDASSTTTAKGASPTFKSTTGFASSSSLSLGAIIGIGVGGGVALLIILGLLIWCCVRRSRRNKSEAAFASEKNSTDSFVPPAAFKSTQSRYANVPQRDSIDSTANDELWMQPVDGNRSRYNSGMTNASSRGGYHTREESVSSMTGAPLLPSRQSLQDMNHDYNGGNYGPPMLMGAMRSLPDSPNRRSFPSQVHNNSSLLNESPLRPSRDRSSRSNLPPHMMGPGEPGPAVISSGGHRRYPSSPTASRSLPGSRDASPSRNGPRSRQAQSSQGHGQNYRRSYMADPAAPPLPQMPTNYMNTNASMPQVGGPRRQPPGPRSQGIPINYGSQEQHGSQQRSHYDYGAYPSYDM